MFDDAFFMFCMHGERMRKTKLFPTGRIPKKFLKNFIIYQMQLKLNIFAGIVKGVKSTDAILVKEGSAGVFYG